MKSWEVSNCSYKSLNSEKDTIWTKLSGLHCWRWKFRRGGLRFAPNFCKKSQLSDWFLCCLCFFSWAADKCHERIYWSSNPRWFLFQFDSVRTICTWTQFLKCLPLPSTFLLLWAEEREREDRGWCLLLIHRSFRSARIFITGWDAGGRLRGRRWFNLWSFGWFLLWSVRGLNFRGFGFGWMEGTIALFTLIQSLSKLNGSAALPIYTVFGTTFLQSKPQRLLYLSIVLSRWVGGLRWANWWYFVRCLRFGWWSFESCWGGWNNRLSFSTFGWGSSVDPRYFS